MRKKGSNKKNFFNTIISLVLSISIVLIGIPGIKNMAFVDEVLGYNPSPRACNHALYSPEWIANPVQPTSKDDQWAGSYIWFGSYNGQPVRYRVLDNDTTRFGERTMLLDCDTTLFNSAFREDYASGDANAWAQSDLRKRLITNDDSFFKTSFSQVEQSAIARSTLDSLYSPLTGDEVFLLDAEDLFNIDYGYYPDWGYEGLTSYDVNNHKKSGSSNSWWLRSMENEAPGHAGLIEEGGAVSSVRVDSNEVGVSPVLNLKYSSIFVMNALNAQIGEPGGDYTLDIIDPDINLSIDPVSGTVHDGDTITISYTLTGTNAVNVDHFWCLVTYQPYGDPNGEILEYRECGDIDFSGTATIEIPSIASGEFVLGRNFQVYIVAKVENNTHETNYVSAPCEIMPPTLLKTVTGLGTSAIINPKEPASKDDPWKGNYVYYGEYNDNPVRYRVLDPSSTDFGSNTMLLDCDTVLFQSEFRSDCSANDANAWAQSDLRKKLITNDDSFLKTAFSSEEQSAIAGSTLDSLYSPMTGDEVFVLDAEDLFNIDYGYYPDSGYEGSTPYDVNNHKKSGITDTWWLRSVPVLESDHAGFVADEGYINNIYTDCNVVGVSPALNINRSSVLFSSIISGTAGNENAEYKLTVIDPELDFEVDFFQSVERKGDTIIFPYITGVKWASVTGYSVLVTDKEYNDPDASILFYDHLIGYSGGSGKLYITLPNSITGTMGTDYHLYVFAEVVNGPYETDYASEPYEILFQPITVTFKVVGGFWNDGTDADKTFDLVGLYGNRFKLLASQIPEVGNRPDIGNEAGKWDVEPDVNTEICTDVTYVYKYAVKQPDKTITGFGISTITDPLRPVSDSDFWSGSYVWYGRYDDEPVMYRVLDAVTGRFGGTTMFLDCDSNLFRTKFIESYNTPNANVWAQSYMRKRLNTDDDSFLKTAFTLAEQRAIAESYIQSHDLSTGLGQKVAEYFETYVALNGDKVFLLDIEDALNEDYGYYPGLDYSYDNDWGVWRGVNIHKKKDIIGGVLWFLRTPIKNSETAVGALLSDPDNASSSLGVSYAGVSPALNIDISSILFSSLIFGAEGETYSEYKLTLLDSDINIGVKNGAEVTYKRNVITVPYLITGDSAQNVNRISVLVTDKDYTDSTASIIQYGKLSANGGTGVSGTGSLTLYDDVENILRSGNHIYIIAEDVNGIYETDYASVPLEVYPVEERTPIEPSEFYMINFDANGGTYTGESVLTEYGKKFGFDFDPSIIYRPGYFFSGWYTLPEGGERIKSEMICNGSVTTLYAHWTRVFTGKVWTFASKSYSKGRFTVTANKPATFVNGYEFAYSADGKTWTTVHKATKEKSEPVTAMYFVNIKKGTYKVRVRAYRIDSAGLKVYGAWSRVVTTQVK